MGLPVLYFNRISNYGGPCSSRWRWSWRPRQGGEGLGPRDQAWQAREGWQDQVPRGDLPLLSAHQRARDHRHVHWTRSQGRGSQDHARPEADQSRSEDQIQGFRRHWRLQRSRWSRVKCSKEVATAIRGAIILAKLSIVPVR